MKSIIDNEPVFVSVIIPVFNDSQRLALCLQALQNQKNDYLNLQYEVIVVDNNSTENIKEVCNQYHAKYVLELQRGSYAARNRGIEEAKGEHLAFTDSDCIPDQYWLEKGLSILLDNAQVGLVGGEIQVFTKNSRPTLGDTYDLAFAFPQFTYIHKNHFAATANMFAAKKIFHQVGLFENNMTSGGDYEWGQRVFQAGLKQIFASEAIVNHPTRSSIKAIIHKSYRVNSNFNSKYHQAKASYKHLLKYFYELLGIHIPLSQAYKKLHFTNKHKDLTFYQNFQLFFLLLIIHYVKTFSKLKEWIKLKVKH